MTGTAQETLTVMQFVMLPRELLRSDAWRSQGINTRRFIDFLMLEHLAHGGAENGKLKAPYRQLEAFGVGARYCADAIRGAEDLGLADCCRGGLRVATTCTLTWLPLHDGATATNRWRSYRNPELKPLSTPKSRTLPLKGKAGLPVKGKADVVQLPHKRRADNPKTQPAKGKAPSRSSYQGEDVCSVLEGGGAELPGGCEKPGEAATGYSPGKPYPLDGPVSTKRRVVL
jgi:hypothetical protein